MRLPCGALPPAFVLPFFCDYDTLLSLMEPGANINKTLLAAQGYFELGMAEDALVQLDTLPRDV